MSTVAAKVDGDRKTATIATKDGIKVLGWEDIKMSDLVDFKQDNSAPKGYKAWKAFHKQNPWVLPLIIKLAKKLKAAGATKWSMRGIFWDIRQDYQLRLKGDSSRFKLNNNYSSFYARAVMKLEPELYGFFEIREKRTQRS